VQRCQVHWLGRFDPTAEGIGRVLQQLPLPFGDLIGVQLELLGQFGQGLVLTLSSQSYLGLEHGRMRAASTPR
jgi:hypothetical protein